MDLAADFKSFQDLVQSSLIDVTRTASQVSNQDLSFHRSTSEKLSRSLDRQNTHLLRLTNKLLKAATKESNIKIPALQGQDDIEDNWRRIVDVVDNLLEKADSALDEYSGIIKRQSPAAQDAETPKPVKERRDITQWSKNMMPKPQHSFARQVNNAETRPFKPLLQTKPHAIVPLEECIGTEDSGYKHPYALEIERYAYPPSVYQKSVPIPFSPPGESEATFVDTEEGVIEMLAELKNATEIAVDLEHHDMHSYIGMVSLMQISTREKDWIIDTLKPWRENLQILNEVFTDPKILKVFHGSNMDMIWLQRDLGLYVVGLFDTFHACSALQFPGKGLKHLLYQFADFEAQKQYQTADWRVRPLPPYLIDYARSDTHFLLHIYDHLRNMLIEASTPTLSFTDYVLKQSKKEALQVYERPIYDMEGGRGQLGWLGLLLQRTVNFSPAQLSVFRAVHQWRDSKARELDEGIQYILTNRLLWQVAENMPMSSFNFHASCKGLNKSVLDQLPQLLEVIKRAKAEGRDGKSLQEVLKHNEETFGIVPRRFRKERTETPTQLQGLGATLQQLTASGDVAASSAVLDHDVPVELGVPIATRSSASHFWGDVMPQHEPVPTETLTATNALTSVLPLPLTAVENEVQPAQPIPPASSEAQQPTTAAIQTQLPSRTPETFTLHDLSRSRKRKADETSESVDVPEIPSADMIQFNGSTRSGAKQQKATGNPEYESKRQVKKQKKAEKKARKQAAKLEADTAALATEPFDYAGAESLLTGQDGVAAQQNGQGTKRMNPFAKALDTGTGARQGRMGKELAGKSMTFQS